MRLGVHWLASVRSALQAHAAAPRSLAPSRPSTFNRQSRSSSASLHIGSTRCLVSRPSPGAGTRVAVLLKQQQLHAAPTQECAPRVQATACTRQAADSSWHGMACCKRASALRAGIVRPVQPDVFCTGAAQLLQARLQAAPGPASVCSMGLCSMNTHECGWPRQVTWPHYSRPGKPLINSWLVRERTATPWHAAALCSTRRLCLPEACPGLLSAGSLPGLLRRAPRRRQRSEHGGRSRAGLPAAGPCPQAAQAGFQELAPRLAAGRHFAAA